MVAISHKPVSQVYSCHPRHLNIGDDALCIVNSMGTKILFGGGKDSGLTPQ